MEKDIEETLHSALDQSIATGPESLEKLSIRLAQWATINTTNNDSRLRERGYALAGAVMDWAQELYPEHQFGGLE